MLLFYVYQHDIIHFDAHTPLTIINYNIHTFILDGRLAQHFPHPSHYCSKLYIIFTNYYQNSLLPTLTPPNRDSVLSIVIFIIQFTVYCVPHLGLQ